MIAEAVVHQGMAEIFADVFMRDDITIDPTLTAANIPGWDSFKQVEIVMATEERFGLRFTSREVDGFRCLGDLMGIVVERGKSTA